MDISESDFACPRCEQPLAVVGASDVTLHGCASCGGIWLNEDDSRKAIGGLNSPTVEMVKAADENGTRNPDRTGWIACPECSERMERNRFDQARVDVDFCAGGHGTWFDSGELLAIHHSAMGVLPEPADFGSPPLDFPSQMSGLAVAGFVLSFFCGFVGLGLSLAAYNEIQKSEGRLHGEGLAMAGIAISAATILLGCLLTLAR